MWGLTGGDGCDACVQEACSQRLSTAPGSAVGAGNRLSAPPDKTLEITCYSHRCLAAPVQFSQ